MRLIQAILAILCLAVQAPAYAETVRTGHAETELVGTRAAIAPGETVTFVLRQKPQERWHTYWINPGDSGIPPALAWTLPAAFTPGPLVHPAPTTERLGPITTYVHATETLYPVAVKTPANLRPGSKVTFPVTATWLICADICVPETAEFKIDTLVTATGRDDPAGMKLLERAVSGLPTLVDSTNLGFEAGATVRVRFPKEGASANAFSDALSKGEARNPQYYPYEPALIDHAAPAKVTVLKDAIAFDIPKSISFDAKSARGDGVLSVEIKEGGHWVRRAFMFGKPPAAGPVPTQVEAIWSGNAAPVSAPPRSTGAPESGLTALAGYILLAFLGGLILNVMPCVLPVLTIKAFSLAQASQQGHARRHGLFFLAGVMVSFLALAGMLLALKAAGVAAGWGFQLQEPLFVAGLALLFFVIGLNLLGAFEFGGGVQNVGAGLAERGGDAGAFFTGALAVVAATPCTAPFMAGALGWAATQPPASSLAVFAGLGLGFAAPFTALSFAPGARRLLPKPGVWMVRLKQALAFPMFATTVWLSYVFAAQRGAGGVAGLLALFVAAGFLAWAYGAGPRWRIAGAFAAAATVFLAWPMVSPAPPSTTAQAVDTASPDRWSPARVTELSAAGTPVFVDFTAAWCVTCKANEIAAISRPAVRAAFRDAGVVMLQADWTSRDATIAAELAAHGRDGVPLYLFYPAGAQTPKVLPQILTEKLLIDTVREAAGPTG